MYKLEIEVESIKGYCSAGLSKGDTFVVEDPVILSDGPICIYALGALMPYLTALYRDTDRDDWINQVDRLQCPDAENAVTFVIKRVIKE